MGYRTIDANPSHVVDSKYVTNAIATSNQAITSDLLTPCKLYIEDEALKNIENFKIKNVIYNPPATIVLWEDGNKTVVKCQGDNDYDPEFGFTMCLIKKMYGNTGYYNNILDKWCWSNPNTPEVIEAEDDILPPPRFDNLTWEVAFNIEEQYREFIDLLTTYNVGKLKTVYDVLKNNDFPNEYKEILKIPVLLEEFILNQDREEKIAFLKNTFTKIVSKKVKNNCL